MTGPYIIDAVRTPVGRRGGGQAEIHYPADMAAHPIRAIVDRTGVDPERVEDVMLGCIDAVDPLAGNIARRAWLAADLPESAPGTTIDRQCGSSRQEVSLAAQSIQAGGNDLVVAGVCRE